MLVVIVRTVILYVLILVVMRIMGKRQLGQLQPFELVITILISELAAVPMEDTGIPLLNALIPILILMVAQIFLSYITLKSERARGIICGKPSILVEGGKIMERQLAKLHINTNDLLEQLRVKGYPDIQDVEFAILETEGQLSLVPKSAKRPVTPEDLFIKTSESKIPITLIIDGEVIKANLPIANMDEDKLTKELRNKGITNHEDVFLACLDSAGKFFVQKKQKS